MYNVKYIDSINKGLISSKYKISGKTINADLFFEILNNQLNKKKNRKGKLFFFGNGASASFSNHMALDWSKNGGILSLCLSDSSMLTALANDYDYESIFLEFLKINSPSKNDLIITTSSSGNSPNIVKVLEYCKKNSLQTLAMSGLNKINKSEKISDYSIYVPLKTYGMVECIHQVFHHLILDKFMEIKEWEKVESQNMNADKFKL